MKKLPETVTSSELIKALIDSCIDRETEDHLYVAGKLYAADWYKRAYGSEDPPHLKEHIAKMQSLNLYTTWDYTDDELDAIDAMLQHSSDFEKSYSQLKVIESKYAVKDKVNKIVYETPQFIYARIAMSVWEKEPNRLNHISNYIYDLTNDHLNLPSPNLEFIGTPKKTATSCCVYQAHDTSKSIAASSHITDLMTVASAGLGNILRIRSIGDGFDRNRGTHLGKLPYLKSHQSLAKQNKQGSRGGALTTYFTCFDPELFDLIRARNPTTSPEKKVDEIDYAIIYNPLFAKKVAANEDWLLISIKDAPDLEKAFFSQDESLFETIFNKYMQDLTCKKTVVKAREIALAFLSQEYETGRFYDINIVEINRHTPFIEPIYTSNLCVAPETTILTKNGHEVISELENQQVTIWNGSEWSDVTVVKTGTNQKLLTVTTNNGYSLDCTPYHKFYIFNGYGKPYLEVRAHELKQGDKLLEYIEPITNQVISLLIESVIDYGRVDDTYCVNEPKRHLAVFNGILTGQCLEILLATKGYHSVKELYEEKSSEYLYITLDNDLEICFKDPEELVPNRDIRVSELLIGDELIYKGIKYTITDICTKNLTALCNIAAINLNKDYDDKHYYRLAYSALMTIRYVILNTEYLFPNIGYTAKAYMSAGVGLMNYAYELAKNNLYYSSPLSKKHTHFIAERHAYMLYKASVEIAKQYGKFQYYDKFKYKDGYLIIDSYNKNVDSIVDYEYKYDWSELRSQVKEHGLAFSVNVALMPGETSSQKSGAVNSIYPIRNTVVVKTDGTNKTVTIVPYADTLQYHYELAWDIPYKDVVDHYAIFQKYTDQGISADYYHDFTNEDPSNLLTDRKMLQDFIYRVKMGVKTKYYTNPKTMKFNEPLEGGCGGGGCTI